MAWFCKECDDLFVFGYSKKYCSEECYDDKQERKAEKKAKKNYKKIEFEKIKKDIVEYKDDQKKQIKNKYNIIIDYVSCEKKSNYGGLNMFSDFNDTKDNVKVISSNTRFKNKIISLKSEENEIKKALKKLKSFK
jgi:hypothetical protein